MRIAHRREWLSSASVIVLALACAVLGVLQYRSIGEIAAAERSRLYATLQSNLTSLSRAFDERLSSAGVALLPTGARVEQIGRENAYAEEYALWRRSNPPLFRRIAIAAPQGEQISFLELDKNTGRYSPAAWPLEWNRLRDHFQQLMRRGGGGPAPPETAAVFEIPRFGLSARAPDGQGPGARGPGPGQEHPEEWLLLEVDTDYLRTAVFPDLIRRYLNTQGQLDYDIAVISAAEPPQVIYQTDMAHGQISSANADASVPLFSDPRLNGPGGRGRGPGGPRPFDRRGGGENFGRGGRPGPPPDFGRAGRWHLAVRSRAGSLEALVNQSQRRNLIITASMLALILATISMLVLFSRQTQRLAELQINFVAGVSHELRTPLTVIRTAAYNLRGARIRNLPEQVERYGQLIEDESEKLQRLVEDVLRFASAKAGHIIRDREPVELGEQIRKALESSRGAMESAGVVIEKHIAPSLPIVLADGMALRHAIQNLLDNALKYGASGGNWIGIYADSVQDEKGAFAQIRIADHGPGIAADELPRLFDPFFRGRRAVQDQIHGTGLGLNLAKSIVEAHQGSIQVKSSQPGGSEFVVRIPAAPVEFQDENTNSAD